MQHHDFTESARHMMHALREAVFSDYQPKLDPFDQSKRDAGEPVDLGYYMPTGNAKLDAILANARPRILYGGAESGVVCWMTEEMRDRGDIIERGSSWIIQPSAERFTSENDRRATLAHELVHWTKEAGRSPRPCCGAREDEIERDTFHPSYPREELVAEIGCALLLDAIGCEVEWDKRASYALNWVRALAGPREAEEAIRWALPEAVKAVDYLLQFAED